MKKSYLTAGLLLLLAGPRPAWCQGMHGVLDQFADAVESGIFQGLYLSDKLTIESAGDDGVTQGANVVYGYTSDGRVVQEAILDEDVSMKLSGGDGVYQGINVFRGGAAEKVEQLAIVNGTVRMSSRDQEGGVQAINIIAGSD
jgi:hypothetical protein